MKICRIQEKFVEFFKNMKISLKKIHTESPADQLKIRWPKFELLGHILAYIYGISCRMLERNTTQESGF